MVARIDVVRTAYEGLVEQIAGLDAQIAELSRQEAIKATELEGSQGAPCRAACATRTTKTAPPCSRPSCRATPSPTSCSQVSYLVDVGQQDKALAQQIARDQETLAAIHQMTASTRVATESLRVETAAQKKELDGQLLELKTTQDQLKMLEDATEVALAKQRSAFSKASKNKAALERALAQAQAARQTLEKEIDKLVAEQFRHGNIPSQYNGTLTWPMPGAITQDFGCTGFGWEPPEGGCAHFHRGIDIVAAEGTEIKASADGQVVYIGWNWADGADPAWIVIIAHAQGFESWYAHMQPRRPVATGETVKAGTVIGFEGNTGHSTGAHLHWAVRINGVFVNPRLFV